MQPLSGMTPRLLRLPSPVGSLLGPEAAVPRTGPGMTSRVFGPVGDSALRPEAGRPWRVDVSWKQTDQKAGSQGR